MKIKQYDRVLLKDGCEASIVEIFEDGKVFLADVDKDGDIFTEEIQANEIDVRIVFGEYDPLYNINNNPTKEQREAAEALLLKYEKKNVD